MNLTDPSNSTCEITVTNTIWNWTASDETGQVAAQNNGGSSWTFPWTPANCGNETVTASVTVTFQGTNCNGGYSTTATGGAGVNAKAVSVDSLTPDLSSGQGGLEDGSDPPTYWVCQCPGDVIVTASSCPSLMADQLPACWSFTGGVEIDKLHHKVSKSALANGPVTFMVTCGTSTETITLEADEENDFYNSAYPLQNCGTNGFEGAPQCLDACGNFLTIDCVGTQTIFGNWPGHYSYRYDGIWVGTCYYPDGNNAFLFKTTKNNCRILRTWHLTQCPDCIPERWTVTKYDCVTGAGPSQNCRLTVQTWDPNWGRPADETRYNTGYPANSCENQGMTWNPCPPYDWKYNEKR